MAHLELRNLLAVTRGDNQVTMWHLELCDLLAVVDHADGARLDNVEGLARVALRVRVRVRVRGWM